MPRTILVQSPVVERTNQNHSHGRISQTVDRWLMRLFYLRVVERGFQMKSKTISAMNIYCSWVLVVIFAGFLILGLAYVHWLLFGAALSLIAFFLYSTNKLKCPKCGQRENLLRLTLALNQSMYCFSCGQKLNIYRKGDAKHEDT